MAAVAAIKADLQPIYTLLNDELQIFYRPSPMDLRLIQILPQFNYFEAVMQSVHAKAVERKIAALGHAPGTPIPANTAGWTAGPNINPVRKWMYAQAGVSDPTAFLAMLRFLNQHPPANPVVPRPFVGLWVPPAVAVAGALPPQYVDLPLKLNLPDDFRTPAKEHWGSFRSGFNWTQLADFTYGLRCVVGHGNAAQTLVAPGVFNQDKRIAFRQRLDALVEAFPVAGDNIANPEDLTAAEKLAMNQDQWSRHRGRQFARDMLFLLNMMESKLNQLDQASTALDVHGVHTPPLAGELTYAALRQVPANDPHLGFAQYALTWLPKIYRRLTKVLLERITEMEASLPAAAAGGAGAP